MTWRSTADKPTQRHRAHNAVSPTPRKRNSPAARAFKNAKKLSVAFWIKKADAVFSRYIRQRDEGQCFTCPYRNDWKKLQNGHFCPRQHMATRFDERNNHAQCFACNMFYGGRPDAYALRLQEMYGSGIVKELHDLARTEKHWTIPELQALIDRYSSVTYPCEEP